MASLQNKENSNKTTERNKYFKILLYPVQLIIFIGNLVTFILLFPFHVIKAIFIKIYEFFRIIIRFIKKNAESLNLPTISVLKKGRGRPRINKLSPFYFIPAFKEMLSNSKKRITSRLRKIKESFLSSLPFGRRSVGRPKKFKVRLPVAHFISPRISYLFLGALMTVLLLFLYQSYLFTKNLPSPYSIGKVNYPLSTHMYDRKGRLLYEVYREQNRTAIDINKLPQYITEATIAIEDKDFYRHNGVSIFSGVLRAAKEITINKSFQGGSTITQQLVKSALLTPERTLQRKIKEIILALWTERIYTKQEILEMYLNQVPYGGQAYGIEEASKTYFSKSADKLSIAEAALLAGLPQAPSLYSPYVNPDLALERRNAVLQQMYEQGYVTTEERDTAIATELNVVPLRTLIRAPHFVFYVKSEMEKLFGIREVEEGGFRLTTTLDLDIQNEAEKILKEELAKVANLNITNGAILVTRPATGEILAMVGSVDYFREPDGAFNVTTALRQPGSSIKPVLYSLALEKGYTAATPIDDVATTFGVPGGEQYRPVNYDGRFHGRVPFRSALANSYNIPAVKVLSTVGLNDFAEHARRMGVTTWNDSSRYGLSMSLGGLEVTMLDMATAFGTFANMGDRVDLSYISKLENNKGEEITSLSPVRTRVMDEGVAYIMADVMSDGVARLPAFGTQSFLDVPNYRTAVKTGTTDEKKDNWTNGFTPEYEVVVWVGNNDNTPMNQQLTSGITGAAPIWNRVMSFVLKHYEAENTWFEKPANVVERTCYGNRKEVFIAGTEFSTPCRELNPPTLTVEPQQQQQPVRQDNLNNGNNNGNNRRNR